MFIALKLATTGLSLPRFPERPQLEQQQAGTRKHL
jgi:hypothetical protein